MRWVSWITFFWAAFVLSAALWGVAHWRYAVGNYHSGHTCEIIVAIERGSLYYQQWDYPAPQSWYFEQGITSRTIDDYWNEELVNAGRYHFAGFAIGSDDTIFEHHFFVVTVPLWFPTVCFALGLLWAHRRKRRQALTRRGFALDVNKV